MALDLTTFVTELQSGDLLSADQQRELAVLQGRYADTEALAAELVRRGWLTPFQSEQLLNASGLPLTLGPYLLLDRLGQGGMGQVFKAKHRLMERIVALKVVHPDRLAKPEALRRFRREIEALARVAHPNIVLAHDADEVAGRHFLVMEYVEGRALSRVVDEGGPLPVFRACDYIRQAALGLEHAHERGLVHRDVKPSNLLLTPQGQVKVLDLGLALLAEPARGDADSTLTAPQHVLGTPDFIAPEQAMRPHEADIRADIYSLGCTLYFLLAGRAPFSKASVMEKILLHQQAEPVPIELLRPDVGPALGRVIRRMMAKASQERPARPAEVAAELQPFCQPRPGEATSPLPAVDTFTYTGSTSVELPRLEPSARARWRGPLVWIVAAVLVAAIVLVFLLPRKARPLRVAPEGGDFNSLAEAVRNAPPGSRVEVFPGTYTEPVILDRLVEIVAEGPPGSVIVETAAASCLEMQTERATVKGLTLRSKAKDAPAVRIAQGRLKLEDCDITAAFHCVVVQEAGTNPTLSRCKVHGSMRAGVVVERRAEAKLDDCDITGNLVGVMIQNQGAPVITKCRINDNTQSALLVRDKGGGTLEHCEMRNNGSGEEAGPVVHIYGELSNPLLQGCTLTKNAHDVRVELMGRGTLRQCTVDDNGLIGVLIIGKESHLLLDRCTIRAHKFAVAVMSAGSVTIDYGDLTGNSAGEVLEQPGCVVTRREKK